MYAELIGGIKVIMENSGYYNQIEPYEGQLEDIESFIIEPPHAYLNISFGEKSEQQDYNKQFNLEIYLCANHMYGDDLEDMYNLIENTEDLLHNNRNIEKCRITFKSFEKWAIFPGFAVYLVNFLIHTEE